MELQAELSKSRALAKESQEKSQELERRFQETDKHFEETLRLHWNETTEPTRRELASLRSELMTKADHVTRLQHTVDEEQLKRFVTAFPARERDFPLCLDNGRR